MDFARSHMESHGWSEGKGLGKSESGRAQAVKVKLKFDKSGIGESGNSEHTFNWWDHAFNRASSNIEVSTRTHRVELCPVFALVHHIENSQR